MVVSSLDFLIASHLCQNSAEASNIKLATHRDKNGSKETFSF